MRVAKLLGLVTILVSQNSVAQGQDVDPSATNNLMYAVAWKQTAAEYQALYYQGFNIARLHVEGAIADRQNNDKPLAVITDVDDTV
ncbi:MAG: acid phosphatase, partial [Gammaproteobacteria bacterium]|nr:acid phosphatase [Gammaproteobacteria bacterium]